MWEFQYTLHTPVVKLTITERGIPAADHNNSTHFPHYDCQWTLHTGNTN